MLVQEFSGRKKVARTSRRPSSKRKLLEKKTRKTWRRIYTGALPTFVMSTNTNVHYLISFV